MQSDLVVVELQGQCHIVNAEFYDKQEGLAQARIPLLGRGISHWYEQGIGVMPN